MKKQINQNLLGFLVVIATLGLSVGAHATPISVDIPDYSSPGASSGFPIDLGTVGIFNFIAGDVLSATISGTWGNSNYTASSAGAEVFLDGLLVATCVEFDDCWLNSTGTQAWSYTFSAADLLTGILDDGVALLQVIQTSSFRVNLGDLNLSGEVAMDIPEPGIVALFGLGLASLGFARRKRNV